MFRKASVLLMMSVFLGLWAQAAGQLTSQDVAERPRWEAFLRTAKIVRAEPLGEGVTKPKKLLLREGSIERSGVWKSPSGIGAGKTDKWECEVAAYRMDKLLGVNMIPPTVARRFRGRKGSLQLWMDFRCSELERIENGWAIPQDKADETEKMFYLQRAFDSLVANADRTLQNLRFTQDWRLVLIDHSRCFRSSRIYTDQLLYGKYGMRKTKRFLRLPSTFVENVRTLTFERIRKAVGSYLTYVEIEAILKRKKLLLREVDELIAERGEESVLY
ncbi:MAG: hypothetical protein ACE5LV_05160 [Candidatus Aminicenantales bacterium]